MYNCNFRFGGSFNYLAQIPEKPEKGEIYYFDINGVRHEFEVVEIQKTLMPDRTGGAVSYPNPKVCLRYEVFLFNRTDVI